MHHTTLAPPAWAEVGAIRAHAPWRRHAKATSSAKPHHLADGTFTNPWESYTEYGPVDFLTKALPELRRVDTYALPTVPLDAASIAAPTEALQATWLGHASFLIQVSGFTVLTDPVFSARASPFQWMGPERYTPPPCTVEELPPVHVVCLSHNHYDHVDAATVASLLKRERAFLAAAGAGEAATGQTAAGPFAPRPYRGTLWVVPLGVRGLLQSLGVAPERIVDLDWWDSYTPGLDGSSGLVPLAAAGRMEPHDWSTGTSPPPGQRGAGPLRIVAVPAQHQSARTAWDRNKSLWVGYVIIGGEEESAASSVAAPLPQQDAVAPAAAHPTTVRCYFSGDTGYVSMPPKGAGPAAACPAFRDIGHAYGPLDLAFLPIGAYSPQSFMSSFHASPEDAVEMHRDCGAKRSIGMHWATWALTDEPIEEPPVRLKAAAASRGLGDGEFISVWPGALVKAVAGPVDPARSVVSQPTPSYNDPRRRPKSLFSLF